MKVLPESVTLETRNAGHVIFPRKRVEGLLLWFGFMARGGVEVERGLIAEGRVKAGSIVEAFDVVENHKTGLLSGFGDF